MGHSFIIVTTTLLAVSAALSVGTDTASALQRSQGATKECTCYQGSGTCTVVVGGGGTYCTKMSKDTCSGTCLFPVTESGDGTSAHGVSQPSGGTGASTKRRVGNGAPGTPNRQQ
jgi:hypothetical protein